MYHVCTCKINVVKYRSVEYAIDILHGQNLVRVNVIHSVSHLFHSVKCISKMVDFYALREGTPT